MESKKWTKLVSNLIIEQNALLVSSESWRREGEYATWKGVWTITEDIPHLEKYLIDSKHPTNPKVIKSK